MASAHLISSLSPWTYITFYPFPLNSLFDTHIIFSFYLQIFTNDSKYKIMLNITKWKSWWSISNLLFCLFLFFTRTDAHRHWNAYVLSLMHWYFSRVVPVLCVQFYCRCIEALFVLLSSIFNLNKESDSQQIFEMLQICMKRRNDATELL